MVIIISYKPWTNNEIAILKKYTNSVKIKEYSTRLNRTENSIKKKMKKLGIPWCNSKNRKLKPKIFSKKAGLKIIRCYHCGFEQIIKENQTYRVCSNRACLKRIEIRKTLVIQNQL
jgi:hypothetical protein